MKKVAIITGGSRGIGAAIAKALAAKNYDLLINYLSNETAAQKLKSELIEHYNSKIELFKGDISDEEVVNKLVSTAINKFKHIDVLINNAGIAIDTLVNDKTKENFSRTLDINLIGPFLLSRAVAQKMLNQKQGKIINISSTNALESYYPMSLDYDASKAGLISLTHNLASEYAPFITVNCVAPGWVNTQMNQELDDDFKKKETEKIYLKRFAEPEEIANVVAFLASEEANYINNTVIRVDGGATHE